MKINFDTAVNYIVAREKGLVEDPNDAGGITNFGISLRFLKSVQPGATEEDIKSLTLESAKDLYHIHFWTKLPYEKIMTQNLVNYIFDTQINMGLAPAVKIAQRACWSVIGRPDCILDDGVFGTSTLEMINHCSFYLLPALRSERASVYRLIAEKNPSQEKFLKGWLNRAYQGD